MIDLSAVYSSNGSGDFRIVNYVDYCDVEIEFINTGFRLITSSGNIMKGSVKDRLYHSVFGVGFIGDGIHRVSVKRIHTKAYSSWKRMLERCYCSKFQSKNKSYIGTVVCDEWCNFQAFADWYNLNYIDGLHLDKDVKQKNVINKVYGPDTCCFITIADNTIEAIARDFSFISPSGEVIFIHNLSKFCRDNNLDRGNMANVHIGKRRSHKGWVNHGKV